MTEQQTANVADYYQRMVAVNGRLFAMGHTLEMFEGLTEAQVRHCVERQGGII